MPKLLSETWNGLLDLVYPPKCVVCGRFQADSLCPVCRAAFRRVQPPICARCGQTVIGESCRHCQAEAERFLTAARASGIYDGPLRTAILAMKYRDRPFLARPLAEFLSEYLDTRPFGRIKFDVVMPVPLHPSRIRERGFNQAALIGRMVADSLGLPLDEKALCRTRRTRPQMELDADERAANVAGAFSTTYQGTDLNCKVLLLIDDVGTTLRTAEECGRALVGAGAKAVFFAAVAYGV